MGISEKQADYAKQVADALKKQGFRVELDLRNEKISYKIREHSLQRLPYQLIVGDKEMAEGLVAVRNRQGVDVGQFTIPALVEYLRNASAA